MTHDTYDRLPHLRLSVFLCAGRYDGTATPANQQVLHQQTPGAQLEFFEDGHQFCLQDPRAFERSIVRKAAMLRFALRSPL